MHFEIGVQCFGKCIYFARGKHMSEQKDERISLISYRTKILLLVFLDILSIVGSYFFGLWARFDFHFSAIGYTYLENWIYFTVAIVVVTIALYYVFRLYHSVWRFASMPELYQILSAYLVIAVFVLISINIPLMRLPRGALLLGYLINLILCVGLRFGYRAIRAFRNRNKRGGDLQKVLIIGAGQAAQEIIKDIHNGHEDEYEIVGLIDDNPMKKGRYLEGIRVEGDRNDIVRIVGEKGVDRIIFAITNIEPASKKELLNICKEAECELLVVPGIYQLYSGEITVSRLKHVEIEDLLGRNEIKVNLDQILNGMCGKRIMVTGGGGSIGSELCRQIAKADPDLLIIFDIYENSTYEIQQELRRNMPHVHVLALIGDVTDRKRIQSVMTKYHPDMVFHAAAHKHVPLMEDSPNEAIKNNVMGTLTVCEEAAAAGVKRFILISTDKAVNPTNIMGASKRLCEMVIQMMSRRNTGTVFMAVRFGNVLGSNGSVIPLFKKQIAEGGPVTVTDKNIIRYFMTIPEAVSLVLQASYYAKGGEIFVLDMGEPVRIDDMARNLIKLSGLKPDVDIQIKYTGLRPGEKLYEELLMDEEGMTKTENDLIYIGHPIDMNDNVFMNELHQLDVASHEESMHIEELVEQIVPTYNPHYTESVTAKLEAQRMG